MGDGTVDRTDDCTHKRGNPLGVGSDCGRGDACRTSTTIATHTQSGSCTDGCEHKRVTFVADVKGDFTMREVSHRWCAVNEGKHLAMSTTKVTHVHHPAQEQDRTVECLQSRHNFTLRSNWAEPQSAGQRFSGPPATASRESRRLRTCLRKGTSVLVQRKESSGEPGVFTGWLQKEWQAELWWLMPDPLTHHSM